MLLMASSLKVIHPLLKSSVIAALSSSESINQPVDINIWIDKPFPVHGNFQGHLDAKFEKFLTSGHVGCAVNVAGENVRA